MRIKILYVFLTITIFLFSVCTAQVQHHKIEKSFTFTLKGKLIGRDTGYVILWYPDSLDKWIQDTSHLKNGAFEFRGKISEPSFGAITAYHREGNYTQIFLEKGSQTVMLEDNNFGAAKMKGSYTQKQFDSLNKKLNAVQLKYKGLYDDYDFANKAYINQNDTILKKLAAQKAEELFDELQRPNDEMRNIKISFISRHPDSYVSPTELYLILNYLPLNKTESLFNAFTWRIKESRAGKLCLTEINKKRKVQIGTLIPDFNAEDNNGQNVSISQFKGKFVLLDFWASWCLPCRKNAPALIELFKRYNSMGLEIIGISDDKNLLDWEKAIKEDSIGHWYNISGVKKDKNGKIDRSKGISEMCGVHFLPTILLIDKKGIIIGRYDGTGGEDEKALDTKLKEIFE